MNTNFCWILKPTPLGEVLFYRHIRERAEDWLPPSRPSEGWLPAATAAYERARAASTPGDPIHKEAVDELRTIAELDPQ